MKRGIVLLLAICLLLPTVAATISITGPVEDTYNVGDTIDIAGYVLQEEETSGYLQFKVYCGDTTLPLQRISIDLASGEQKTFSQIEVPDVTTTSSMVGTCSIKSSLIVSGTTIEEDTSESFTITQELNGLFDLDKTQIQMGDSFKLEGTVTKLNAEKVTGTAEVYFEKDGEEYLIDVISIYGGTVSYIYDSANTFPGEYDLNLIIRDSYGNQQRFDAVSTFEIVSELSIVVDTEEDQVFPGDILSLFGSVKDIEQNPLDQASIDIKFNDDLLASTSLIGGEFQYELQILSTITTGTHTVYVEVEDMNGNSGTAQAQIEVMPIATSLELSFEGTNYIPKDTLEFEVIATDQAEEEMNAGLTLEVSDSTGALASQRDISSSSITSYKIPEFATPGIWQIKAYIDEVEVMGQITVDEYENIEMWVEGENLYIKNAGNVRFKDDLQVLVSGAGYDYTITKKRSVAVNETVVINLAEEVPSGSYSIEMPTGSALLNVDNVEVVNGTKRYRMGWLYIVILALFVGGLSYLVYGRVPRKKKPETTKRFGKPSKTTIMAEKPKTNKKPSLTFEKEKGLADFKERIVKDIRATEAKIERKESRVAARASGAKLATVMGKKESPPQARPQQQDGNFFKLFD
jgi:hypothetical protein